MSQELNVTIYEPCKDPYSISRDLDPEFIPLIDRVYFNADGSLCDDFVEHPEDLSDDELIGFNLDSLPPAIQPTEPPVSQRQKKLQMEIDRLLKMKDKPFLKCKLQRLRKKLRLTKERESGSMVTPRNSKPSNQECTNQVSNENTQPRKQLQLKPNSKPITKTKKPTKKIKRAPSQRLANKANSQPPNPHKFPAFIRNPWIRKAAPKYNPTFDTSANNLDYIPIGNRSNHQRFNYNGHIPPLSNSRYFNYDNC